MCVIGNPRSAYAHNEIDVIMKYRKGGPLDRCQLDAGSPHFLKIFSKLEKEPLDVEASRMLFEKVAKEINASHEERFSIDEIVYG